MTDFGRRAPAGLVIKSIQSGVIKVDIGHLSNTATINEVDTDKALLIKQGQKTNAGFFVNRLATLKLTNSNTVTAERLNTNDYVSVPFTVIEFTSGVESVQRGQITLHGVISNTATINQVDTTKALLFHLGERSTETSINKILCGLTLTNSTTVTAKRTSITGTALVCFEILEFE